MESQGIPTFKKWLEAEEPTNIEKWLKFVAGMILEQDRESFKKKVISRVKCYRDMGNKNDNENIHWTQQFGYHW